MIYFFSENFQRPQSGRKLGGRSQSRVFRAEAVLCFSIVGYSNCVLNMYIGSSEILFLNSLYIAGRVAYEIRFEFKI